MRRARAVVAAFAIVFVGCFHDFDAFDPAVGSGDDAGDPVTSFDGGDDAAIAPAVDASDASDARAPLVDSAPPPFDAASGCGAQCRTTATGCAGLCADGDQSCEAECDAGAACVGACRSTQSSCLSTCVTTCETCTSQAGCVDPAGCTAAAP